MIKFENPNNGRFYYINIGTDMLNDMFINIVFGGRYVCRNRIISVSYRDSLFKEIIKISKRRIKRGYILIQ